ncbi:ankyrin repeat and zinc finger domain-containing protein 1-like [Mya arenaria]|uniref:ankyrin repeat and zinc finger domain-containing protein 1-like n=1 Tax=Mya arenaria TaxID=6604 RepID=UPI0022E6BF59|nr:ankyrin repeat and zinc finger domain-containing protein 1-like [Mya arenaria]
MATNSPKRVQRVKPKKYTTCQLYNTKEAQCKLVGLTLASCNSASRGKSVIQEEADVPQETLVPDPSQLVVSEVMACNYCDTSFSHRVEQKRHYRSDWHRYNLKLRLKGKNSVPEEVFEDMCGNISSLSGSDSDTDGDTDIDNQPRTGPNKLLPGTQRRLVREGGNTSSTDSESESGNQTEDIARRLPKVYFSNHEGEILSIYRCVLCHKKSHPSYTEDLVSMAATIPDQMNWAVFMAGGGHFAGAVFNKNEMVVHKTFHRYVVRAKRGTAQGSRDSQGNAPKSGGASLRRYNEAALTQEIQELIASWRPHLEKCDLIFLRAPSFNRKIFYSGKVPAFKKDDLRIRLIPFQTRRPTNNEVRRVFEMLASIECYGDESEIQDLVPISPPQVFNPETGNLEPRDENQLSPRKRKLLNKKIGASPLVNETNDNKASGDLKNAEPNKEETVSSKPFLPDHIKEETMSSGTSTASDTELIETMATIHFSDLKEYSMSKKPKQKKKSARKRRPSLKGQNEPDSNVMDEELYHLRNSLYTACKTGDKESLESLLAVIFSPPAAVDNNSEAKHDNAEDIESQKKVDEFDKATIPTAVDNSELNDHIVKAGNENDNICLKSSETSDNRIIADIKQTDTLKNGDVKKSDGEEIAQNSKEYVDIEKSTSLECITEMNSDKSLLIDTNWKACDTHTDINTTDLDETKEKVTVNISSHQVEHPTAIPDTPSILKPQTIPILLSRTKPTVSTGNKDPLTPVFVSPDIVSEPIGDNNTTLLHVAAKEGHARIVALLLEAGASPVLKDRNGHSPYMASKDKATRNEFRRFRGKWPDRYDYKVAQIPEPLSEEAEAERKRKEQERKKAQKKAKQEQQKAKKEEEEKQKAEDREKQRYLNMSDREKRALAAERRLLNQCSTQGGDKPVLIRCFQCGADMTGKVPFEYCDNKFCTSKCLQQHRKTQTAKK